MDEQRARQLIDEERRRLTDELEQERAAVGADIASPQDLASYDDAPPILNAEATDAALIETIEARLGALDRAEGRLAAGTYGRSVRSGVPIPDERLEADPAAELTVEEASERGL